MLDKEQKASYLKTGSFKVVGSSGALWEIRKRGHPLRLLDDGKKLLSFCINSQIKVKQSSRGWYPILQRVPVPDKLIMLKLWIESDDASVYLKYADFSWPGGFNYDRQAARKRAKEILQIAKKPPS